MRNLKYMLTISSLGLILTGCVGPDYSTAGARTGALLGAISATDANVSPEENVVRAFFGSVVGAHVGHEIGRELDEVDRRNFAYGLHVYPAGQYYQWENTQIGTQYQLLPQQTYMHDGHLCRLYTLSTVYNGETVVTTGQACQAQTCNWHFQHPDVMQNKLGRFSTLQLKRLLDGLEASPYTWMAPGGLQLSAHLVQGGDDRYGYGRKFRIIVGANRPSYEVIEGMAWRDKKCFWNIQH